MINIWDSLSFWCIRTMWCHSKLETFYSKRNIAWHWLKYVRYMTNSLMSFWLFFSFLQRLHVCRLCQRLLLLGFSPLSTHNSCDLVWITTTLVPKFAISSLSVLHDADAKCCTSCFFFVRIWNLLLFWLIFNRR